VQSIRTPPSEPRQNLQDGLQRFPDPFRSVFRQVDGYTQARGEGYGHGSQAGHEGSAQQGKYAELSDGRLPGGSAYELPEAHFPEEAQGFSAKHDDDSNGRQDGDGSAEEEEGLYQGLRRPAAVSKDNTPRATPVDTRLVSSVFIALAFALAIQITRFTIQDTGIRIPVSESHAIQNPPIQDQRVSGARDSQ
jgi:hypothetical protein